MAINFYLKFGHDKKSDEEWNGIKIGFELNLKSIQLSSNDLSFICTRLGMKFNLAADLNFMNKSENEI